MVPMKPANPTIIDPSNIPDINENECFWFHFAFMTHAGTK